MLLLEHARAGRDVRLVNDDRIGGGLFRFERHRIASSGHAYGLPIDRRGAVLADDAIRSFVETDRAADLAGVEYRGHFAVGFFDKARSAPRCRSPRLRSGDRSPSGTWVSGMLTCRSGKSPRVAGESALTFLA